MPITSAARLASRASSSVQQPRAPVRSERGFLDRARWTPVTSWPASAARAAATAESTPPDIAASTRSLVIGFEGMRPTLVPGGGPGQDDHHETASWPGREYKDPERRRLLGARRRPLLRGLQAGSRLRVRVPHRDRGGDPRLRPGLRPPADPPRSRVRRARPVSRPDRQRLAYRRAHDAPVRPPLPIPGRQPPLPPDRRAPLAIAAAARRRSAGAGHDRRRAPGAFRARSRPEA